MVNFEHKGHILSMLKDIPFFGKNHEDAYKHIKKVLAIENYFNGLKVSKDVVLLRMIPITLKDAEKDRLESLAPGAITTWDSMKEEFIKQFTPPLKVASLKKNIVDFQ